MGNRLDVGFLERDEFVRQESQRPTVAAIWRVATCECDEASFVFTVDFSLVCTVGIAAMYRRNPVLTVPLSRSMSGHWSTIEGVSDIWIADALISPEKDSRSSNRLRTTFTVRDERFEFTSFIFGKINRVLLVSHSRA